MEIKNAVIEGTTLDIGDRGCLQGWIQLTYGNSTTQGFGGYVLYLPKSWKHHKIESVAGHWIFRIMEIAEVTEWAQLIGKTIRVKSESDKIEAIGHIVKDDWFYPAEDFKNIQ